MPGNELFAHYMTTASQYAAMKNYMMQSHYTNEAHKVWLRIQDPGRYYWP